MLSIPPTMRVFVATGATDMRKSFSGLAGLTRSVIEQDPMNGHLFVFFNKRRTMMKAVFWDRNGYALLAKKLAKGTFVLPEADERGVVAVEATELMLLLDGIDLSNARTRPRWERAPKWSSTATSASTSTASPTPLASACAESMQKGLAISDRM
jgi:transposase